jgi:hypothetical protein
VDVAVISQATAARLSWPLWSQPLGAGHLLLSVSYGSELFEAGSGGLRLLCRRTGRRGRPNAMRDILGVLAGQGIGPGLVLLVGGQFGAPGGAAGPDSLLLVPEAARMIAVSVGAEPCGVMQADGQPISWVALACELQRDWARQDTVAAIIEIVLTDRLLKEQ